MAENKRCFVIMPFGKSGTPEYSRNWKIYDYMIKPVVDACGYTSIRADELEHMGNITRDIIELLHESDLVVADLSGHNANVFYELGVRHALYRAGTIPIIRDGETLPFDIANYRAVFYSSELDGPEKFKAELKRRIKAFEKLKCKKSDNPVHDILGDKLFVRDLKNYVPLATHNEVLKEKEDSEKAFLHEKSALEKRIQKLEEEIESLRVQLRSEPIENLSANEVKKMLKERDFFNSRDNKQGKGLNHQYEVVKKKGKNFVIDKTTGLTWQQSGSPETMVYADAEKYIKQLNDNRFAGYDDWRLPTLEEAMSLMETEQKNGDLHISGGFDQKQSYIWTSDKSSSSAPWVVLFLYGYCGSGLVVGSFYVRAVR